MVLPPLPFSYTHIPPHGHDSKAWSIVHGPILYGDMALPHLYTYQGLNQLKFLQGHLRTEDKTCKLIYIAHGYTQLTVGLSINFLNHPTLCVITG